MTANQLAPTATAPLSRGWTFANRPPSPVLLLVTGGYHAGASLDLSKDTYTLGSDVGADIVLADPGIAAEHVLIRRNRNRVDIEATGGDVELGNGETIAEGHGRRCNLPVEIKVGSATVKLEGPAPRLNLTIFELPRGARPVLFASIVIIAIFAISYAANGLALPDSGGEVEVSKLTTNSPPSNPAAEASSASQAAVELQARLGQTGLDDLTIQETDGRILVKGQIPGDKSAAWTDIQTWFDRSYGTQTVLSSEVRTQAAEAMPRLKLRAIWFGDRPYVISTDGARYYEGAFTKDGWTVAEIGDTQLLLTKGSARIALTYP